MRDSNTASQFADPDAAYARWSSAAESVGSRSRRARHQARAHPRQPHRRSRRTARSHRARQRAGRLFEMMPSGPLVPAKAGPGHCRNGCLGEKILDRSSMQADRWRSEAVRHRHARQRYGRRRIPEDIATGSRVSFPNSSSIRLSAGLCGVAGTGAWWLTMPDGLRRSRDRSVGAGAGRCRRMRPWGRKSHRQMLLSWQPDIRRGLGAGLEPRHAGKIIAGCSPKS